MEEETLLLNELAWDKPYYILNGQPFIPLIAQAPYSNNLSSCNAVTLRLDGRLQAGLEWKEIREQARTYVDLGYALFWEIDLGLFNELKLPIANQTQHLSLALSLEHFRDTLWKEFKFKTLGISLYRGSADFSYAFPWDEQQLNNLRGWLQDQFQRIEEFNQETHLSLDSFDYVELSLLSKSTQGNQLVRLFCRDVIVEYLALLASRLPDSLPCYTLLDASYLLNPLWHAQLLHPERFEQLNLIIKGSQLPFQALGWDMPSPYGMLAQEGHTHFKAQQAAIGVCLPLMDMCRPSHYQGLEEALNILLSNKISFRLIPESQLITEWDGLDYLIYVPNGLSIQGKRKLQGFCAAGGTVITLGQKMGLPYEISLPDLMENYC